MEPTKHAGGRPKELTPALMGRASGYLDTCQDSISKESKKVNLPTIEGLALFIDVSRETIYQWEKENEEFSDITEKVRAEQARRLINEGLSGNYQHVIAGLLLGKHGYRTATDVTTNDKDLPVPIMQLPHGVLPNNGNNEGSKSPA